MRVFFNLRVLHNNKNPKLQSIKLMINRPKQSNPHTNAVNMKGYNSVQKHRRKTTTSWLFHPLSLFAAKSSSCLSRLLVFPHKFAFNIFFYSSHFFLCGSLIFCLYFCFFSLDICTFLVFWHNQRKGALFKYLFFWGRQIASKTKRKWKASVPPLWKNGETTDRETDFLRADWLIIN